MKKQVSFLAGALAWAHAASAGRPLAVDDADPADPGRFEFEAGAAYERVTGHKHWDLPFGLACGLVPGVEEGGGFGGQLEERTELLAENGAEECVREHGIGDLGVGAKWQFMPSCPLGARHALVPSVKFPTADEDKGLGSGKSDYDLTWIASRSIGEKWGAHVNAGSSWIGGPDEDVPHYGLAIDCALTDTLQWAGEVSAEKVLAGGAETIGQYNTGFRWNPGESLTVDLAGGSKITGDAPDFVATMGLTWAFGSTASPSERN